MKKKILKDKTQMRLMFIFGVAAILLIAIFLVSVLEYIFVEVKLFAEFSLENTPFGWIMTFATISIIIGFGMTFIFEKVILKPIYSLLDGMEKLSKGEFSTRIDLGKVAGIKGISEKFNALAEELESTEILRSDFINDFSHEFKTPIVSISSLISLMKNGELSKDKQRQYLHVIEEEINRLSEMTTNVLTLTRIENQGILTGKTKFNLSEQIRNSVLLLEKKWAKKHIILDVDFEEHNITANEDMLKQVWINLLDNAIKFANKGSELKITLQREDNNLIVTITDEGAEILEEDYEKIFQKFYQTSAVTKKEGNGIGLSIVKHIIDLHGGKISAKSKDGFTTFTIVLPKR